MAEELDYVYTHCMGTACHEHCALKTYVKDGKIVRTERAKFPGPEEDWVFCCQKGIEYAKFPYEVERLKYPLKRTGKRGEGKFERISWDQAISEIGEKLRFIRDNYGPASLVATSNPSGYPGATDALAIPIQTRFFSAFGGTFCTMNSVDQSFFGAQCADFGSMYTYNQSDPRLISKAEHVIIWSANPLGNTRAGITTHSILEAQEKGAKVVAVGVIFNSTAAVADEFVAVKPGSDLALGLSLCRELIKRGGHNVEYLTNMTVAPFFVREDNRKFLRASDIGLGGDEYVAWDPVADAPVAVAAHTHTLQNADLDAVKTINGIAVKTAFVALKEHLEQWTPEFQESYTNVPAATVRRMMDDFIAHPLTCIYLEEGMRYANGVQSYRAVQLLSILAGSLPIEGAGCTVMGQGTGSPSSLNKIGMMMPEGIENVKVQFAFPEDLFAEMEKDNPKYHAYFNMFGNCVHAYPNRQMWENFFGKMDLVVVCDIVLSDTCMFADYVLPDKCSFERDEIGVTGNHVICYEHAIEADGEQKSETEIWNLIAAEVGLGHLFQKNEHEWFEFMLNTSDPTIASVEPKITWERLRKDKIIRLNQPDAMYNPLNTEDFVTRSGRVEFYAEQFAEIDMCMATWVEPIIDRRGEESKKAYPFQMLVGRPRLFMQTQPFNQMPDLLYVAGKDPWMWINYKDAQELGIHDGDMVEIYNDKGNAKLIARLTNAVPRGLVEPWLNYRVGQYVEGGPTYMMNPTGTMETYDAYGAAWRNNAVDMWGLKEDEKPSWELAAKGKLPGAFSWDSIISGNYDITWENYCNVRLVEKEA